MQMTVHMDVVLFSNDILHGYWDLRAYRNRPQEKLRGDRKIKLIIWRDFKCSNKHDRSKDSETRKNDVASSIMCFVLSIHMQATNPYKMRLCSFQLCPLSCKHRASILCLGTSHTRTWFFPVPCVFSLLWAIITNLNWTQHQTEAFMYHDDQNGVILKLRLLHIQLKTTQLFSRKFHAPLIWYRLTGVLEI